MDKNQYFEKIYQEYFSKIYDYMKYRVRNCAIAEELTEDVFIAVYKNLHIYNESRSFIATWLYAIAGNRLKNYYKSQQYKEYSIEDIMAENPFILKEKEDSMAKMEMTLFLEYLLEKLPERNRQIVHMKYYYNMTSSEIGKILNISSGNVRIILKRSLSIMRKLLYEGDF